MTTESTVRTVLGSSFETYSIEGHLRSGDRHAVYEVAAGDHRAVCKVTGDDPALLEREGRVLATVGERTPVPVPGVIAAGDGALVLEWVDGETYASESPHERARARLRSLGQTMARLHDATEGWFEGHGHLATDADGLAVADPRPWPDRLGEFVEQWAARVAETSNSDVGERLRASFAAHRTAFTEESPVLVHGELAPDHVHFDGENVAGVLDWELAQAAPGEFDLAWAERDFLRPPFEGAIPQAVDDDLGAAIPAGYDAVRTPDEGSAVRRNLYRAAFATRSLGLLEDDETYGETSGAELRTSLRRYVYECLDAIE